MQKKQIIVAEAMLPPEMLYNILSFLDEKALLKSKLVNRTWYHFINDNEILLKKFAENYLLKTLRQKIPDYHPNFLDKNYFQLISKIKFLSRRPHENLSRAQIALQEQMLPNTLFDILKHTFRGTLQLIQDFYFVLFGNNLTLRRAILSVLLYTLTIAHSVYFILLFSNQKVSYLQFLIEVPFLIALSILKKTKNTILALAGIYFCKKLYENYQRSLAIHQQQVIQLVENESTSQAVPKKAEIATPTEYLTISWKRSSLFSSATNNIINDDEPECFQVTKRH